MTVQLTTHVDEAGPEAGPSGPGTGPDPAEAVAAVLSGGGCAVVSGPAGIGKSRTLRAAAERLRGAGRHVTGLRSTTSLATVPFGALLPLLAEAGQHGPRTRTETALAVLTRLLGAKDRVLLVDDAHLLDASSAGVLHQAAAAGVPIAVAVRSGEPMSDAVARLVPDLGAVDIRVPRLTEQGTGAMLATLLGDAVDDRMTRDVHRRSAGLPLAVQALARIARETGVATQVRGEWRLHGEVPVSDGLAVLMRSSTAVLDEDARHAAELVAIADGLTDEELTALGARRGAERAEQAGVLQVAGSGVVLLAHPLLLDALLADLPDLRRREHLADLIAVLEGRTTLVAHVRRTDWRLELGRAVEPEELVALVDLTAADDPDRGERYARAAIDAGGGVSAQLRLAEVLAHLHRADAAEAVLAGIDRSGLDREAAVAVELTRAFLLNFALARPDEAFTVLSTLPDVPMVAALRSTTHFYAGRFERAEREAAAIAERADLPTDARAHAALTRAGALVLTGDAGFTDWLPTARGLVAAAVAAIPEGGESLRLLEGIHALRTLVDPAEVDRVATAGYRDALARGDDGERSQWSHQLGEAALLRGDPGAALAPLRHAARSRGRWAVATTGWVRGALVRALALAGLTLEATRELDELRTLRVVPSLMGDVALAEAEVAACRLDLKRAALLGEQAAQADPATGLDAWYLAMRYGRPGAAAAFLARSEGCAGAGRVAQRLHARALVARDAEALEEASAGLEQVGLGWFAVDAMVHAVQVHARRHPGDPAPRERLRRLAARYPTLRSPLLAAVEGPTLTEREAQIAQLVAAGSTARTIAVRLGIGVRTVETHVAHAYRKLGVGTREELRTALLAH